MPDALATATTNTNPNSCVNAQSARLCKPWIATSEILTFMAVWESGRLNGVTRIFYANHTHIDAPVSEGFILPVYRDDQGNPTVGCGHLVVPEDNLSVGQTISVQRAREFLRMDLRRTENALNSKIHVPLFQYEYNALVSVTFNAGAGHAADDLAHRVNQGDYENIAHYIINFRCHNPRLQQRRQSEARVFAEGVYNASH